MSDEPLARKAMRSAEQGVRADVSGLVASVPRILRESQRRRNEASNPSSTFAAFAARALPRLAAATAVAVVVATSLVWWERSHMATATVESVIVGGEGESTGDAVFDALLDLPESDG